MSERQQHGEQDHGSVDAIIESVTAVRAALTTMIVGAGADPAKTRESARHLDVDRNLIWLISKVIKTDDLFAAALEIPTAKRIEGLCRACREQGASEADIATVMETLAQFDEIVDYVAGSRAAFADLVQGLVYDDVTSRQEETRKVVFRGNSSIWGVQARVNFKTGICMPSKSKPGMIDAIRIGGLVGLKRLRQVPWSVFRMITHNDDGSVIDVSTQPLDPSSQVEGGMPLLKDFCSESLDIQSVATDYGKFYDLMPGPIGKAGLVDCVFGDSILEIDQEYSMEGSRFLATKLDLQTPSELVVLDMYFHNDLNLQLPPEIMLVDRLSHTIGYDTSLDERHRLPLSSSVIELPPGSGGGALSAYPAYSKILTYALHGSGFEAREFRGYRFMMKYPVVPSALLMRVRKVLPSE